MSEPLPFEQQHGESPQAYAAFCRYRDLPRDVRSIDVAWRNEDGAKAQRRAPGHWTKWSHLHRWVERTRSYDAGLDARIRHATEQDAIVERRAMLQGHAKEARRLRRMNDRILDEFERRFDEKGTLQWIPGEDFIKLLAQVSKHMQTAHHLERLAMGEPAENIDPVRPLEDMTADELSDYVSRLRAVVKD